MQLMIQRQQQMQCMENLLRVPCLHLICLQWLPLGGPLDLWATSVSFYLLRLKSQDHNLQSSNLLLINEPFKQSRNAALTAYLQREFLQADSLLQLARALVWAAGHPQKGNSAPEDEDTAVFCLELLIAVALNNRDRIGLLWQGAYEHIANIVQSTVMPCMLVEKAVFGFLQICQRLLP